MKRWGQISGGTLLLMAALCRTALAAEPGTIDSGDTAYVLICAAMVFVMTPGLAFFYGGMVRSKNVLTTIMQSFFMVALISVEWVLLGYTMVFGANGGLIGGLSKLGLTGVGMGALPNAAIPELAFVAFQCMFAVITPALISGAFAERVRFGPFVLFVLLWVVFLYNPMAHWVWGGGFLAQLGALDFAGGLVIHILSGVSGLVLCLLLGQRSGYGRRPMLPHHLPMTVLGAALLWFGWFGFNAGSALGANALAANAVLTTQVAAAASPPKKSTRAAAWIVLVVLLLVVAGLGGRWWWTEYGPGSYLTMPETTGRTLTDVQADLDALGLHTQVEEEFSDDIDTGSVTRSDPEGGSSVHKRAQVQLYVSKGVDMKTVPELTGKSQDEAQHSLTEAGLTVGAVTDAYSEDVPQGQVISQSVATGTSLAHDSAVDIVLSKGRQPLTVPTLSGLSASAAKSAIEDLGLVAAPTDAYSDTVAEGQVISQQTREGSTLYRGDSVAYTVSKGPEKVAIPDVVGLQREEARSRLESAGFTVKEEAILGGFFGTVRSSDPAAGTMTKKGSTVTITIV